MFRVGVLGMLVTSRIQNMKVKNNISNLMLGDINKILVGSKTLKDSYLYGKLNTEIVTSFDGVSYNRYLGYLCDTRRDIVDFFRFVSQTCFESTTSNKSMQVIYISVSEIPLGVDVSVYFVEGSRGSIQFRKNSVGELVVASVRNSEGISPKVFNYDYFSKLLRNFLACAIAMSVVPLHSVEVWKRDTVKELSECKKSFVGYSSSPEVDGEFTMAFLIG